MKARIGWLALSLALAGMIPSRVSAQAFTIVKSASPTYVVSGQTVTICLDVTSQSYAPKADIVWVLDATSSMTDTINAIKANIASFTNQLTASGLDYRQGLQIFRDVKEATPLPLEGFGFAPDDASFLATLGGVSALAGEDPFESILEAIEAASAFPWRADATKHLIIVTDSMTHSSENDGLSALSYETVLQATKDAGIVAHSICPWYTAADSEPASQIVYSPQSDMRLFAQRASGLWFDFNTVDWSDLLDAFGASMGSVNNLVLHDPLPPELAPIPGRTGGGVEYEGGLVWSIPSFARGESRQVCAEVLVQPGLTGEFFNTARASADGVPWVDSNTVTFHVPTPTITMTPPVTLTPTITLTPTVTATPTITDTPMPTQTPSGTVIVWPNPFDPGEAQGGTLKCALPPGGTLLIYTVSGEKVFGAVAQAGQVQWDGSLEDGRKVAPGIYYYLVRKDKETLGKGVLVIPKDR